jgi:hypothetical protein
MRGHGGYFQTGNPSGLFVAKNLKGLPVSVLTSPHLS